MTTSIPEYPKYFLRIEAVGCDWHQVEARTYLDVERRWSSSRDAPDGSTFSGNGIEGKVYWRKPCTEKDVISGVH